MHIQSAAIAMASQHSFASVERETASVEIIRRAPAQASQPEVNDGSRQRNISEAPDPGSRDAQLPAELQAMKHAIEMLTGRLMALFDAGDLRDRTLPEASSPGAEGLRSATPRPELPQATAMRVRTTHEYAEYESMQFAATGVIRTADGKDIDFSLQLSMQRQFVERSSAEIVMGDVPRMKDPLVVNFDGSAAELTAGRHSFDLDADGITEQIPGLAGGHAFLVLDRNGNGKVDDGSELFGALSGDAYADLRALDEDGNGFIDEVDGAFAKLGVWQPGDPALTPIADTGLGAFATQPVSSPFQLTDADNAATGQIRSTSIYVSESGQVGTTQQVDLVV